MNRLPVPEPPPHDPLEWTFDPWSETPRTAALAALSVLAMWLVVARLGLPWLLALAVAALAASPLLPAAVPSACRVAPEGASRRGVLGWARRSWAEIRRVERVPIGVLLSPYAHRHWLEGARALTLPMPAGRRAELAAAVEARWRAHAG